MLRVRGLEAAEKYSTAFLKRSTLSSMRDCRRERHPLTQSHSVASWLRAPPIYPSCWWIPCPCVLVCYLGLLKDIPGDGVQVAKVFDGGDVLRHSLDHHLAGRQHQLMSPHLQHGAQGQPLSVD